MSEYEKWFKRNWKNYAITKWKKDFGVRLVGKLDAGTWHRDHIVLIYNFKERIPTVEDLAVFIKDFERFYDQYDNDYILDGAYFVIYDEYNKKVFNLIINKTEDIKKLIHIKLIEDKIDTTRSIINISKQMKEKQYPSLIEPKEHLKKRVFIVHGREKTPALELARFVEKRHPI